jgi:hypothetical protein
MTPPLSTMVTANTTTSVITSCPPSNAIDAAKAFLDIDEEI